ncbi:MAG: nuclear transport factor 2 family protein [Gemmatimonadaceae bacterium]
MKSSLSRSVPVFLLSALAAINPTLARAQSPEARAIIALENAWGAASITRDGAAVGRMLAPDFTFVDPDGKLHTKAQLIATINGDTTHYISGANSAMSPRVHGGAVVITGVWTKTVKTQSGTALLRYRWTDTWVRNPEGGWMCIAGQSVRLAK